MPYSEKYFLMDNAQPVAIPRPDSPPLALTDHSRVPDDAPCDVRHSASPLNRGLVDAACKIGAHDLILASCEVKSTGFSSKKFLRARDNHDDPPPGFVAAWFGGLSIFFMMGLCRGLSANHVRVKMRVRPTNFTLDRPGNPQAIRKGFAGRLIQDAYRARST